MIINFKIKNYNSYKGKQILNFEKKSKEQASSKFINKQANLELLKVISLVGVNGSGKTSLLEGLNFMKEMVLNSQKHNVDTNIRYSPFLNNIGKPIEFEITFISENKKYIYGFSYTNKKILKEFAIVYETQKSTEGGRGSGRRGHQKWMLAGEAGEECENCMMLTDRDDNGKCILCGN